MKKILIWLYIVQKYKNKGSEIKKGKGYLHAYRLNPFNPLSYITIIISLIIAIVLFGVIGFTKETNLRNPFKWN